MSNTRYENGINLEEYLRNRMMTEKGVWKMDNEARRIGNDGGLTLVEELADLKEKDGQREKELADLKKGLEDLKEKDSRRDRMLWKVRVSELERVFKKTYDAARFERNEIVHGADILNDYQALRYADRLDNQTQFKAASEGFKKAYGLQLSCLSYDTLSKAPEGLIEMLTMRGNLTFLNWFRNHKEKADMIQKQCDEAVHKWLKSIEKNGMPYPEDVVKADYEKINKLYDSVRAHEAWC